MDVILDLHWSDRGALGSCPLTAGCQQLMPDATRSRSGRRSRRRYEDDGRVMFELYNEPHDVRWDVWPLRRTTAGGLAGRACSSSTTPSAPPVRRTW